MTISKLRASLDGETADQLLFINKNGRSMCEATVSPFAETVTPDSLPVHPVPMDTGVQVTGQAAGTPLPTGW